MEFTFNGGVLAFSYKPADQDNYPVTIVVNDKELLLYTMDVAE